jgi:bifunctional non-homologous end joining protein LigD
VFALHGQKLAGLWELVCTAKPGKQEQWLLFKKRDAWARPAAEYDVVTALPDSVVKKPLGPIEEREHRAQAEPSSEPDLGGVKKAALPAKLSPQLATLAKTPPTVGDWLYEIKFDGYRILTRIERGKARLITRNGHDWTAKMGPLAKDLEGLGVDSAWLDGEAVVLDADGVPNFNALQNAFDSARTSSIVYFLFDAPFFEGYDLRAVPLQARRELLRKLLAEKSIERVRFSKDFPADAASVLQTACTMKLEGVIAKRKDAPYVSARTDTWLKLKCQPRQEFVIIGFNDRTNAPGEVGSLLLGYHDDNGTLRYGGSVGTGWNSATGAELHQRLRKIETTAPAVATGTITPGRWSRRGGGGERWVKPQLVAEVSFGEWTPDGKVRHASFQGLREDKPASAITRERATAVAGSPSAARKAGGTKVGNVKVTNADRVIDASTGLKKIDLVHYYESIAERMQPHLKGRPVSLVRGPTGVGGELFFQKHDDKLSIPKMRELDPSLWPGHAGLLEVPSAEALVNAAQMNVIEFHTWNSTVKKIDQPDRIVFDLDPGEGVGFERVKEGALLMRALLQELKLEGWLKTSGGKGLHVVVPIAPRLDYDTVKHLSQAIVQHLARTIPSRFVAKSGAQNRKGRIFVDYLRNGHGQTTAAAFSARARPGLGVSMPVSWEGLGSIERGDQWTIQTAREYLSFEKADPWQGYWKAKQRLTTAMKLMQRGDES